MRFHTNRSGCSVDPNKPGETLRVSLGTADSDSAAQLGFIRRDASGIDGAHVSMNFQGNDNAAAIVRKLRLMASLIEQAQL